MHQPTQRSRIGTNPLLQRIAAIGCALQRKIGAQGPRKKMLRCQANTIL
jgi:hypothetical protein